MALYVPRHRVRLSDWCAWTGNDWNKVSAVVGEGFRVPAGHENVYTMAANAVLRLILQYDVDPQKVGFLALGTDDPSGFFTARPAKDPGQIAELYRAAL